MAPGSASATGFEGLDRTNGGRFVVDMWPEVSEYDPQDLCEVPGLKMPDGSPARLYSAFRKGPVLLHCKWMREYGIDGVFLSRFVGESANPARARHINTVLANVREGCHREGRVWAMNVAVTGIERTMLALHRQTGEATYRDFVVRTRALPEWDLPIIIGRRQAWR